jgi:hypothetical protein
MHLPLAPWQISSTARGPIDVGDVLSVGAGAATTALLYWAREFGFPSGWDIVDGDIAKPHNSNRCLTITAADAGWPNGEPTATPLSKATTAARAIGARAQLQWYDRWQPTTRRATTSFSQRPQRARVDRPTRRTAAFARHHVAELDRGTASPPPRSRRLPGLPHS